MKNAKDQSTFILHAFKLAKIVQLGKTGVDETFFETLISTVNSAGFEVYSHLQKPGTKPLGDQLVSSVLGVDLGSLLDQSLTRVATLGLPTPYGGCGLTQAQWVCFDDFYGGAIYGDEAIPKLWSRQILFVLFFDRDLPVSSPNQVFPLAYTPDPLVMWH